MLKNSVGLLLFAASIAFCQTPPKDSDSLQSVLIEVRQLRQAIEGITVASQRVQIALFGLQMQDSVVARAAQRLDTARSKCSALEVSRQHLSGEVQRMETGLASGIASDSDAKEFKARLPGLKTILEEQTTELRSCQSAEAEASNQLRNDQAKLLELQDRIAHLDRALEQSSATGK